MKNIIIIGLNFRLLSLSEAEEVGCERTTHNGPELRIPIIPRFRFTNEDPSSITLDGSTIQFKKIDLTPRKHELLIAMKEYLDCFKECEEMAISSDVFHEIDSLFRDETDPRSPLAPNPYQAAYIPGTSMHFRLSHKCLETIDAAVGRIYEKGAWSEDYVNIFIVRGTIAIFFGKPVLYAQTNSANAQSPDQVLIGYGYTAIKPDAMIRLVKD